MLRPMLSHTLQVLSLLFLWCYAIRADSQTVNDPCESFGVGNCDISVGRIVTVYWDTAISKFDSDVLGNQGSAPTHLAIDEFIEALQASSYFRGLDQYGVISVITSPSIAGGSCTPTNRSLNDLYNNAQSTLPPVFQCILEANPSLSAGQGQLIINFVLPPASGDLAWCQAQSPPLGGWHDQVAVSLPASSPGPAGIPVIQAYGVQAYTIIPVACAGPDLPDVEHLMSHEFVETLTDPHVGVGWTNWGSGNEIADECENTPQSSAPFLSQTLNGGQVSQYWSNIANACTSSLNPQPPTVVSAAVCGSGPNMIITANGTFPFPSWDMQSNAFSGQTPYIEVQVASVNGNWGAGLPVSIPGNQSITPVGFANLQANSHQITITGFTSGYGSTVGNIAQTAPPGSNVIINVTDPTSGASTQFSATVPSPSSAGADVYGGPSQPYLFVNDTTQISGQLEDSGHCVDAATPVTLTASAGSFPASGQSSITLTTDSNGKFNTTFLAPSTAGVVNVTLASPPLVTQIPIQVYPVVTEINPSIGPVAGGQPVTISGSGFTSPDSVTFTNGVTTVAIDPPSPSNGTLAFTTKPSPLAGDGSGVFSVSVTINNVTAPNDLTYAYIVPDKPVITPSNAGCGGGSLTVFAYDKDGKPIGSTDTDFQIILSGPSMSITGPQGPTNSLTMQSGQTVQVSSDGPFTAVGQTRTSPSSPWTTSGTTTGSFPLKLGGVLCGALSLNIGQFNPNGINLPPGPVTVQKGGPCDFCGNPSQIPISWGTLGNPYLTIVGNPSLATDIGVAVLDLAASQHFITEYPYLLSPKAGRTTFRSPVVEITYSGKTAGSLPSSLPSSAILSLPRSAAVLGANSRLEIFRLIQEGEGAYAWVQDGITKIKSPSDHIRARIADVGSYILVEIHDATP